VLSPNVIVIEIIQFSNFSSERRSHGSKMADSSIELNNFEHKFNMDILIYMYLLTENALSLHCRSLSLFRGIMFIL